MNVASAELTLIAIVACTGAGFLAGRSWGKRAVILKVAAVLLAIAGLFAFYCAAFTE